MKEEHTERWERDAAEFAARRAVVAAAHLMVPTALPIVKMPARYVMRYGVVFCLDCSLAAAYCRRGEKSADAPSSDATAAASWERRIRDAKAGKP